MYLKKTAKSKQSPDGRKFAQSGNPGPRKKAENASPAVKSFAWQRLLMNRHFCAFLFRLAEPLGRVTTLGEFLPDWANFCQIGRIFARLGEFLPDWANFCQIGRIFAHPVIVYFGQFL
jgi:hypothetical protein